MVRFIQNYLIKKSQFVSAQGFPPIDNNHILGLWKDLEPHVDTNSGDIPSLVQRIPEALWIYNYNNKSNGNSEVFNLPLLSTKPINICVCRFLSVCNCVPIIPTRLYGKK